MGTAALEVADIFRTHGPAWRQVQRSHPSLRQLKVMTAIEQCRSAALGGHVLRCQECQRLQTIEGDYSPQQPNGHKHCLAFL